MLESNPSGDRGEQQARASGACPGFRCVHFVWAGDATMANNSLPMEDQFSSYYKPQLQGRYDCVDRIVLNAYFRLGMNSGGFCHWWRRLTGDESTLDDTHLMRMAGRFARRVRAWATKSKIPVIDCKPGQKKYEIAQEYLPKDPSFVGIFLVLVARGPGLVWKAHRTKKGFVRLEKTWPLVNHYMFHIIDRQWGHLMIRVCGHPPFTARIYLNGHEWVERQAKAQNLKLTKEANAFTQVSNAAQLAKIAETLSDESSVGRLHQLCERWIYSSCLCFGLGTNERERSGFAYGYSVGQVELSRNLLFGHECDLERIYQGVIDRNRSRFDLRSVSTIFGRKNRPLIRTKQDTFKLTVERPMYNLTVFKLLFGKLGLKMYDKGGCLLRIEATAIDVGQLRCGKVLDRFPIIISHLRAATIRLLNALECVDHGCLDGHKLQQLNEPSQRGSKRVAGVDIQKPRMRAVVESIISLSPKPKGFSLIDLVSTVQCRLPGTDYGKRQAAYDLAKLRAKGLVERVKKSRCNESRGQALRTLSGLWMLHEKILEPVLAGAGRPKRGAPPKNLQPVERHYAQMQRQMLEAMDALGLTLT